MLNFNTYNSRDAFGEYLKRIKENDRIVRPYINECATFGLSNSPLFFQSFVEEHEVSGDESTVQECCENFGIFLCFPDDTRMECLPTRSVAFSSICQRAGLSGQSMTNIENRMNQKVLDPERKAAFLSECMQLYSDNAQILVRDGMVSAMHSKKYGWLLPYDVFPIIEEYFRKTWPDFEFKKAVEDDAYLYADYLLHDEVAESSMELILKDLGMGDIKVKAGIRVSTSDVGLSALRFTPFYEFGDGSVRLGKPVEIVHESRNTLEVLKEKYLDLVGVLLKECEDEVEKLGNQMITYPAGCLQHVVLGTRCLSYSMVENAVGEMTVQYPSGCTAIDVYLKLNEIVESNKATCRPGKYLDLLESIGRLLFIDYTKYDIPVSDR